MREKLQIAKQFAEDHPEYQVNVQYLEQVQPKDLDASEIEARLGATWISEDYITRFMAETFHTPRYYVGSKVKVQYAEVTGQWNVMGKMWTATEMPLLLPHMEHREPMPTAFWKMP